MPPSIKLYKKARRYSHALPHIVYDMSIEDLEERKEKAIRFETAIQAAQYIGLRSYRNMYYYTDTQAIKKKKRYWSEKHQKYFAIRRAPQGEVGRKRIQKDSDCNNQ